MPRRILFSLLCLFFAGIAPAQPSCDFDKLFREGKLFAKQRQYKKALYKYNSARRCNPAKGDEVDAAIEALFNQVEGEKTSADQERERALAQEKRANEKTVIAQTALDSVELERNHALLEKKKADEKTVIAQKARASTDSALFELKKQQEKNKQIISLFYFYDDKIAPATRDGKFGYIDKEGRVLIDFKYDQATTFGTGGFAKVIKNSKPILIDTLGREYSLAEDIHEIDSQITALDLSKRGLKKIPYKILKNTQIEILFLNDNKLKHIPKEIKALTRLKYLNLSRNSLSEIPEEIGLLSQLETLDISGGKSTWTDDTKLPDSVGEFVYKINNKFNYISEKIIRLPNLKHLNLKYCVDFEVYQTIKNKSQTAMSTGQ